MFQLLYFKCILTFHQMFCILYGLNFCNASVLYTFKIFIFNQISSIAHLFILLKQSDLVSLFIGYPMFFKLLNYYYLMYII